MNDILNEDIIFGKKRTLGDYSKNAICSYWIEMIRSPVLLTHVFPTSILSLRNLQSLEDNQTAITSCFAAIEKLNEEVLKTIFDNNFYPSVQEKCIELITNLIDNLFPEGADNTENIAMINSNSAGKKIQ